MLTVAPVHAALRQRPGRRAALGVGLPLLLGLVHVAVVSPLYFVGSFDDDASYIMVARALASGHGLGAHVPSGAVVAGLYPPGYPLLLAPLVVAGGHATWDLRGLSVAAFAALFALTWLYLGRRRVDDRVRMAVLVLLALSPVAATFATMVMPEMPFLVVFVAALVALDRWERQDRVCTRAGAGVVAAAVALVWLKEAAAGMVAGLVLWLVLRRAWRKGAVVVAAVAASLLPVVAARLSAGIPLAGSRYSQELGAYYRGSLGDRLVHVLPAAAHAFASVALPATVVPRGVPLPLAGWGAHTLRVLAWQVTLLSLVGAVVWARRHLDGAVVIVGVYLAETLLWPYINERRVILVLPVILAWYALGAWTVAGAVLRRIRRPRALVPARSALAALAAAVVVVPLAAQFGRDYLFGDFQDSPRPGGSRYMAFLAAVAPPGAVIETDYLSTTALFTGRRTADTAFLASNPLASTTDCTDPASTERALAADGAGWVLTGSLNKPLMVDNPCILDQATTQPWSVRLLRSAEDGTSVFELIGPGTVHPHLRDLTAGASVATSGAPGTWPLPAQGDGDNPGSAPTTTGAGPATFTWAWGAPAPVTQVSVGGARSLDGPTSGVTVQLRLAGGQWRTVAAAPGGVGDPPAATPFLLGRPPAGTDATAVRVTVAGPGRLTAVDVHALGPSGTAP